MENEQPKNAPQEVCEEQFLQRVHEHIRDGDKIKIQRIAGEVAQRLRRRRRRREEDARMKR